MSVGHSSSEANGAKPASAVFPLNFLNFSCQPLEFSALIIMKVSWNRRGHVYCSTVWVPILAVHGCERTSSEAR